MEGQAGDGKGKDVALDERRRDKGPGVDEGELRHEVEVRDHDLRVRRPLAIANGGTQDRLDAQGDEHDARHGRDIYSGRHGGQSAWSGTRSQLFGVAVASRPICWWPVMKVGPGLCSVPRCLPRAGISCLASGSQQFCLPQAADPTWQITLHGPIEQRPETLACLLGAWLLPSSLRELDHPVLRNEGPLGEARDFNTSIQR